jgi:hypothetical protein
MFVGECLWVDPILYGVFLETDSKHEKGGMPGKGGKPEKPEKHKHGKGMRPGKGGKPVKTVKYGKGGEHGKAWKAGKGGKGVKHVKPGKDGIIYHYCRAISPLGKTHPFWIVHGIKIFGKSILTNTDRRSADRTIYNA